MLCYPISAQFSVTSLCCARFDESRQRRKLVTPFPYKGKEAASSLDLLPRQLAVLHSLLGSPVGGGGEEPLKIRSWRSRGRWVRESEQGRRWGFDYLISRGSVTLTNSSSTLNFAPRCEEWGILGHWLQVRLHFESHNEWVHLLVPIYPNIKSSVLSVFLSIQYSARRSNHSDNDTKLCSQKTQAELKKFVLRHNINTNDILLSWFWNAGPTY